MEEPALIEQFDREMKSIYDQAAELGYRPRRFLQMVQKHGGLEAARRLLDEPFAAEGFTSLVLLGRTDLSVEAVSIRPECQSLFTEVQRSTAQSRLDQLKCQGTQ